MRRNIFCRRTTFYASNTPENVPLYNQILKNNNVGHYTASEKPVRDTVGELPGRTLRRAIEFINDNLDQELALAEIAAAVGISPYHFARLFKQSTGLAPHQYVLDQRIERAKTLLSETALPLAEIAYRLGFASQSHFTALFRRFTSTTPNAYRKSL